MNYVETLLLVLHLVVAVVVCGFVLLQHGKGADMGAAFGSGSSGSLFGAAGSANFLSRTTAVLAAVFFLSSIGLTYLRLDAGQAVRRDAAGRDGKTGACRAEDAGRTQARGRSCSRPGRRRRRSVPQPAQAAPRASGAVTGTGGRTRKRKGEIPKLTR